jgi:hypothetical protein
MIYERSDDGVEINTIASDATLQQVRHSTLLMGCNEIDGAS